MLPYSVALTVKEALRGDRWKSVEEERALVPLIMMSLSELKGRKYSIKKDEHDRIRIPVTSLLSAFRSYCGIQLSQKEILSFFRKSGKLAAVTGTKPVCAHVDSEWWSELCSGFHALLPKQVDSVWSIPLIDG